MHILIISIILLLAACAAQLTEEEKEQREYEEADRINLYIMWEQQCKDAGGIIFSNNPHKMCRHRRCVPSRLDWKYDHERERASRGNRIVCISRQAFRDIFR